MVNTILFPNELVRASPFIITDYKKEFQGSVKRYYEYGRCQVMANGLLFSEDRGMFLELLVKWQDAGSKPFTIPLSELAPETDGTPDFFAEKFDPAKSLVRLTTTKMIVRTARGRRSPVAWSFISADIDQHTAYISLQEYHDAVEYLNPGMTSLNINFYQSLESELSKSLYLYLASQQIFYNGGVYEIRLASLVKYINCREMNKADVIGACQELRALGFAKDYMLDKNRFREAGGLLRFSKKNIVAG